MRAEDVGEPGLRIDVVHLGRDDQAVHRPRPARRRDRSRRTTTTSDPRRCRARPLGGIVGQADAAVVEEARERGPALEHVVHGLGDIVAARELGALLAHPGLQIGDQRRAEFLADGPAPFGALSVDRPLDLEQRVDPADRFQRQRRDQLPASCPAPCDGRSRPDRPCTKNGRRAWTQQAASRIGPGVRPGS